MAVEGAWGVQNVRRSIMEVTSQGCLAVTPTWANLTSTSGKRRHKWGDRNESLPHEFPRPRGEQCASPSNTNCLEHVATSPHRKKNNEHHHHILRNESIMLLHMFYGGGGRAC
eukprot:1512004-Amphidinium_carterae.1